MFVGADSNYGRMESLEYGLLDIAPGDVAFIRPEIPTWYGPRDGDWHQRWVIWGGPGADRLAEWMRMDRRPPIFHGAAAEVRTAQLQLSSLLSFSHPEAVLTREAILRNMIARVFECERHRDVRSPVKDAIDHSVRHLTEHLHSPLDLTNLARLAGMSESRFRRRFHAHTGFSPIRFLIWHRIERAKALLAGGVPIKETAAAVGMPDPFYFMRTFKRETGTTAAAYATAKRGDR
jgi:AraC-like DNA-binding protein